MISMQAETVKDYKPFGLTSSASIKVVRPGILVGLPLFQPPNDKKNSIFVTLEGFGSRVPISIANLMESSFTSGLVTRLLLGELARAWAHYPGAFLTPELLRIRDLSFTSLIANAFEDESSCKSGNSFEEVVSGILKNNPVLAPGLLWGWHAGDDLDDLQGSDTGFRADVWKLIASTHSWQQIGQMTSFTLKFGTTQI